MASLPTSLSWDGWRCRTRSKASAAPHRGQTLDPSRIYKPQAFWGKALSDRTFNTHTPLEAQSSATSGHTAHRSTPAGNASTTFPTRHMALHSSGTRSGSRSLCRRVQSPVRGQLPPRLQQHGVALWDPVNLHAYHPHQTALHEWSSPRAEPQYLWHISHRKPLQQEE